MNREDFVKGMAILGKAYGTSYTKEDCELWYEFLGEYSLEVFRGTIKNIIRTSKFAPKISDMIENCEKEKLNQKIDVVEYMSSRGYFGQASEKEKAIMFINKEIIPQWLKDDLDKYEKEMKGNKQLRSSNHALLEG